jgi:tetratricopeptide (TPR) repeat protein
MARKDRRKSKPKKTDHSQRMSRLKAKALAQVAHRAWQFDQRYRSVALLTEALRRDPKNHELLLSLATAHGRRRKYEDAEKLLTRLLDLAPRKASVYRKVARAYVLIDRPDQAVDCYRRSLELNSDSSVTAPILLELARLYERRHQLDDAQAALDDALAREPENEEAHLQRAILTRRQKQPADAEVKLCQLVGTTTRSNSIRCQAWYELGQLLDEQQRYDDAFAAFTAAKEILKPHAAPYLQQSRETLRKNGEMVSALNKDIFERWRALGEQDTPYRFAVLTSHPRSGTTLVEQLLDSHDELISADEFDVWAQWVYVPIMRKFRYDTPVLTALEYVPAAVHKQARATYWKQTESVFDEEIGSRMLLDKNPGMTVMLPVVNWTFPEVKMLIALRDPRDVILSCFMQRVSLSGISAHWLSLEDAAEYYDRTMKTWLAMRDLTPSQWLEFRYEDVVADLESHARKILGFLGLPWDDKVLKFYEHAREKLVRSPTYKDVTQPVYHKSVGRWQHYARHFEPILEKLSPYVNEFGYTM